MKTVFCFEHVIFVFSLGVYGGSFYECGSCEMVFGEGCISFGVPKPLNLVLLKVFFSFMGLFFVFVDGTVALWGCFGGGVNLFWALLKYLFGIFFSRLLKQI